MELLMENFEEKEKVMKTFGKALILTAGIFCGYFDALISSKKISAPAACPIDLINAAGAFFKYFGKV